jgi:hypothetical protein
MSLLSIITGACEELSIAAPDSVIDATDGQTMQLLQLCSKDAKDLLRRFDWQALTKEASFTTSATEQQTTLSTVASDFFRMVDRSMWDRTRAWPIQGPVSPISWQQRKAAFAQVSPQFWFRIRGNAILFNPVPPSGNSIFFEYISSKWCQSSLGVAQTDWAADTDTALIDEEILRLGVIWRWRKAEGLDYGEDMRTYELGLEAIFGSDGARGAIDMGGDSYALPNPTVPDGGWNI